jgi:hypothetical protein
VRPDPAQVVGLIRAFHGGAKRSTSQGTRQASSWLGVPLASFFLGFLVLDIGYRSGWRSAAGASTYPAQLFPAVIGPSPRHNPTR